MNATSKRRSWPASPTVPRLRAISPRLVANPKRTGGSIRWCGFSRPRSG
jgi:hypothetical protein